MILTCKRERENRVNKTVSYAYKNNSTLMTKLTIVWPLLNLQVTNITPTHTVQPISLSVNPISSIARHLGPDNIAIEYFLSIFYDSPRKFKTLSGN